MMKIGAKIHLGFEVRGVWGILKKILVVGVAWGVRKAELKVEVVIGKTRSPLSKFKPDGTSGGKETELKNRNNA
jgi:hypothetical protein